MQKIFGGNANGNVAHQKSTTLPRPDDSGHCRIQYDIVENVFSEKFRYSTCIRNKVLLLMILQIFALKIFLLLKYHFSYYIEACRNGITKYCPHFSFITFLDQCLLSRFYNNQSIFSYITALKPKQLCFPLPVYIPIQQNKILQIVVSKKQRYR